MHSSCSHLCRVSWRMHFGLSLWSSQAVTTVHRLVPVDQVYTPLHRVLATSVTTLAHHLLVHYQLPLVHLPLVTIFQLGRGSAGVLSGSRSAIMANPQAVSFPKTVMIVPLLEFLWSMELMVLEAECQQQKIG